MRPDWRFFLLGVLASRGAGGLRGAVRFSRIDPPTAMHIHSGATGVAGPIVVDLTPTLTGPACVTSTTALVREIDRDPQDFYLNIHTTPFSNGAIRGQLEASIVGSGMPTMSGIGHLFGRMSGGQEVPGPGDANGRGAVFIDIHPGAGTACVNERYAEIATPPQLMHIHSGATGVSGPIVVNLTTALNGGPACVAADPVVLRDIRSHPTLFYCNIHNVPFPNGAIRGQLKASE